MRPKHPWLPQRFPDSATHRYRDKEIRNLKKRLIPTVRALEHVRREYRAMQIGFRPFTLEMIEVKARYQRIRMEVTRLKQKLRVLEARRKSSRE